MMANRFAGHVPIVTGLHDDRHPLSPCRTSMSALEDLKAAQFMLGPMYSDWVWQERVKSAPVIPQSKMRVLFKWQALNVVPIRAKVKK